MEIAKLVLEYIRVLIWPLTTIILVLTFRKQFRKILTSLRKADLPGGVSLDFYEDLEEAKLLSENIEMAPPPEKLKDRPSIPFTEANKKMIELGLKPSPSGLDFSDYRQMAENDPNLALAGLRIEIDILARNLAKGFGVEISPRDTGMKVLRKLLSENAITKEQLQLTKIIYQLTSEAIHGQYVTMSEANSVLDVADVLAEQYLSWLSWGFGDGWES